MLDFNKLDIIEKQNKDIKKVNININLEDILDKPYSEFLPYLELELSKDLDESNLKTDDALMINVFTDLEDEHLDWVRDNIINTILTYLNNEKPRSRERRLGLPTNFKKINIQTIPIMNSVNNTLKVNILTIEIFDKDKKNKYPIIKEEV